MLSARVCFGISQFFAGSITIQSRFRILALPLSHFVSIKITRWYKKYHFDQVYFERLSLA
jgi:hypothetical protein